MWFKYSLVICLRSGDMISGSLKCNRRVKTIAWVRFKLFINSNERRNTIDVQRHRLKRYSIFEKDQIPERLESKVYCTKVARTTESIFHQNIIIMLALGDKGQFEKYRNAFFSDFDANLRKISKFEKNFFSKSTCHFSLLSIRYVIRSGTADFKFVI